MKALCKLWSAVQIQGAILPYLSRIIIFYLLYMFNLSHSSATSTPAINWRLLLIRCFMLIHPSLEKKKNQRSRELYWKFASELKGALLGVAEVGNVAMGAALIRGCVVSAGKRARALFWPTLVHVWASLQCDHSHSHVTKQGRWRCCIFHRVVFLRCRWRVVCGNTILLILKCLLVVSNDNKC